MEGERAQQILLLSAIPDLQILEKISHTTNTRTAATKRKRTRTHTHTQHKKKRQASVETHREEKKKMFFLNSFLANEVFQKLNHQAEQQYHFCTGLQRF